MQDLAAELRANPQGVADRVKDKLNQVSLQYQLHQERRLHDLESSFHQEQREAEAVSARQQMEKLEAPRTRLVLVLDQLEEMFTSGFPEKLQASFIAAVSLLARSGASMCSLRCATIFMLVIKSSMS